MRADGRKRGDLSISANQESSDRAGGKALYGALRKFRIIGRVCPVAVAANEWSIVIRRMRSGPPRHGLINPNPAATPAAMAPQPGKEAVRRGTP